MNIGTKTENGGTTAEGRLSAAEFNELVAQVEDNVTDIGTLDTTKVGYVSITTADGINTVSMYSKRGGKQIASYQTASLAAAQQVLTRLTSAETRITALEETVTSDESKVGYGKGTDKAHVTTLAFYADSDSTTALFTMDVASSDVYSLLNDRLTLVEQGMPETLVKVIDDYNLQYLMTGQYTAAELSAVADLLVSSRGGVVLMRTEPDASGDTFFSGYTYIVYDGTDFNLTLRKQVHSFHYFSKADQGRFTLTNTGTTYTLGSKETIDLLASEEVTTNEESVDDILAVLTATETTETT